MDIENKELERKRLSRKMYNRVVVMLSGKAGVGKDWIADKLVKHILSYKDGYSEDLLYSRDLLHTLNLLAYSKVKTYAYADYLIKELQDLLDKFDAYDMQYVDDDIVDGKYVEHAKNYRMTRETIAKAYKLCAEYNLPFKVIDKLFWLSRLQGIDLSKRHADPNYRKLLQWYGTDVRRKQNKDYWVGKLIEDVLYSNDDGLSGEIIPINIITDVRFENEYSIIREIFPDTLFYNLTDLPENINKREQKRDTKAMNEEEKHHISETGLPDNAPFDRVFDRSKMSDDDIVYEMDSDIEHLAKFTYSGTYIDLKRM